MQEGGPNPRISLGSSSTGATSLDSSSACFDFSQAGRPPRHVTMRGDSQYRQLEGGGGYLHLLPGSCLMIATQTLPLAFSGNCGGQRLNQVLPTNQPTNQPTTNYLPTYLLTYLPTSNQLLSALQYSITAEVMFEKLPLRSDSSRQPAPVFSLAPFGEAEPLLTLDCGGKLSVSSGHSRSDIDGIIVSNVTIAPSRWFIITLSVDTFEGQLDLFVNGSLAVKYTSAIWNAVDSPVSLGPRFSLFSGRDCSNIGGSIRRLLLSPRSILPADAQNIASELQQQSQSGTLGLLVDQLGAMGYSREMAEFAAGLAEGPTLDARLESALNFLMSE